MAVTISPLAPDHLDRPVRLLAGPGAGKTQALVDLYVNLVESGHAVRGEILVLTFSNAAAGEIAGRLDDRLRDSYDEAWISTFHSFCHRLLRDHRPDPGRMLMSGFQEWLAMKRTLAELDTSVLGSLARVQRTDGFAQDALAFVALLKQNRVHPAQLSLLAQTSGTPRLQALVEVYRIYQARLDGARLRDFRDLVEDAIAMLEALPGVLERYRRKFRYVLVDELQDVDPAQFYLLRLLVPSGARADEPHLVVAGDPDQSIYGFRGTVPRLLADDFAHTYPARTMELPISYRCPPEVLAVAYCILEANQPGWQPRRLGSRSTGAMVPVVRVAREATAVDEAAFVAREIRRLMIEQPGLRPGDFAVLLRSTATHSAPLEEALRSLELPYDVRGVGAFARNEVVRFLLTYLQALHSPDEPEALERVLASGLSGVGARAVGRVRRYAIEEGRAFTRVVRRLLYWLNEADPELWPLPWQHTLPREVGGVPGEAGGGGALPHEAGGAPGEAGGGGLREVGGVPGEAGGWGTQEAQSKEPARPPEFAQYLTEEELHALHRAVTVFYEASRRARRQPVLALAYSILIAAGVMERILDLPLPESERREALAKLRAALDAFAEMEEVWQRLHGTAPMLADVAPRLESLVARAVDDTLAAPGGPDSVQIMTVHQAKGLEFDVVFLSGFAQGLFPLAVRPHPLLDEEEQRWLERSLPGFRPSWPSNAQEHTAEEARLAYVGATRAQRRLYVTYADEYDGTAGPSPFLEPAFEAASRTDLTRSQARLEPAEVLTQAEAETLLAGTCLTEAQLGRLTALGADLGFITDPAAGRSFEPHLHPPQTVDPDHFSPTTINDYLKCPRLYWYNHHPGLVAPPRGVEMERGSFLHRVLEDFHSREPEWRHLEAPLQREWLERALATHLEGYLNRVEAVLDRRAEEQEVRRILGNYVRFATSFQPIRRLGTLTVERKFKLWLEGAEVRGKIDRVNDTGGGTCEVVDYKTGRGRSAQHAYDDYFGPDLSDVQLVMYYWACQEGVDEEDRPIGLRPRFLSLWYPKDTIYGSMRQVLFPLDGPAPGVRDWMQRAVGEEDMERGRRLATEAIKRIRAGDFAPDPRATIGTCLSWFGCPHAQVCPFGGQPAE
jgi:superfamily I DNA/RNA helicase